MEEIFFTKEEDKKIIELYKDHLSIGDIAEAVNRHYNSVLIRIRELINSSILIDRERLIPQLKIPKLDDNLKKDLQKLKRSNGGPLMTFLVDKWHKMSEIKPIEKSASYIYFYKFYKYYNIPLGIKPEHKTGRRLRFLNFFTSNWVAGDTLYSLRQSNKWGCEFDVDDRLNCKKMNECHAMRKKKKCNINKMNVWVQNGHGAAVRFTKNYLKALNREILKYEKINLQSLLNIIYMNNKNKYNSNLMYEQFTHEFNIKKEELEILFLK